MALNIYILISDIPFMNYLIPHLTVWCHLFIDFLELEKRFDIENLKIEL